MQVERNADGRTFRCWLTERDYDTLLDAAESYRDDHVLRLGGEAGLRSFEIPQIRPGHISRHVGDESDAYFLRVPRGKDTRGEGGKPRDAYLPRQLERDLRRYIKNEEIDDGEPIFPITARRVQQIVSETAERAAERTGDEDFRKVSSHDLRRYFAHTMLVRERMNPRVVMEVGGWEKYESLEPYLNKPDPDTIIDEFERAGRA